jgi:GT2 family glycosyltransferase
MLGPMDVLVVVPTLGQRPDLLRRTVASIASQQPGAPRTLVVAAGDVDAVRACCDGLDAEVVPQRSAGLSQAINEGWERAGAGAEAWTWLGDDDELLPGSLARTVRALVSRPTASMAYGRCRYVDAAGRTLWTARPGRLAAAIAPYGPNLIPQPGSLLRASAVRRVGPLDPALRYAMDIDLFLRLRTVGDLVYVPAELAVFRWHAESTTVANQAASQAELAVVQQRHRPERGRRWASLLRPAAGLAGQASYRLDRLRPVRSATRT